MHAHTHIHTICGLEADCEFTECHWLAPLLGLGEWALLGLKCENEFGPTSAYLALARGPPLPSHTRTLVQQQLLYSLPRHFSKGLETSPVICQGWCLCPPLGDLSAWPELDLSSSAQLCHLPEAEHRTQTIECSMAQPIARGTWVLILVNKNQA